MPFLWGIDLGGTKIECAVLDADNFQTVKLRRRLPTEADQGYAHIISQIGKLVDQVSDELGERPTAIGFATPGVLDPVTGTMKNCNTVVMNDQPMQRDLEARLGVPCHLANDANCFALAETLAGAVPQVAPDAHVVFGVILGTGVGGGVVVNGHVIGGRQGIGGEWGHIFLAMTDERCYCGKKGCVEQNISGPSLQKFYEKKTGERRTMAEILKRHEAGTDPAASETIERLLTLFGRGLSTVVNILDPDVIVLGGGVSNVDLLYSKGVERLKKYVFNPRPDVLVVKNVLGDSAGVFGAALLVK